MYLIDTNVWLERLLDQRKSEEVGRFLDQTLSDSLFLTDFSFHSICVIMNRLNKLESLTYFVNDVFIDGGVFLVRLEPGDTERIIETIKLYGLDFDDAYQYVSAEKYDLTIVSFDSDFDRTDRGRKTPSYFLIK